MHGTVLQGRGVGYDGWDGAGTVLGRLTGVEEGVEMEELQEESELVLVVELGA